MTEARLLMFRRRPVPLPSAGIIDFLSLALAAAHRMTARFCSTAGSGVAFPLCLTVH